jgi:putative heme-binding domain-containing protein
MIEVLLSAIALETLLMLMVAGVMFADVAFRVREKAQGNPVPSPVVVSRPTPRSTSRRLKVLLLALGLLIVAAQAISKTIDQGKPATAPLSTSADDGAAAATKTAAVSPERVPAEGPASQDSAAARGEMLIRSGRVACADCHVFQASESGDAPNLSNVGARLSQADLVDAILFPSHRIAAGYDQVTVELADGRVVQGVLVDDGDETLEIDQPAAGRIRVAKTEIESVRHAPSDMPTGLTEELTESEFADLIAYLQSCRETPAEHVATRPTA